MSIPVCRSPLPHPASGYRVAAMAAARATARERALKAGRVLEIPEMAIYNNNMDISVTEFKHHCLEIIRRVEKTGKPVSITRRGKVVVRLIPSGPAGHSGLKPWEQLRALGGRLLAKAGESVLHDEDFEALR